MLLVNRRGGAALYPLTAPVRAVRPRRAADYNKRTATLADDKALERFLAEVERRAYRMAVTATRNPDEALDLVQDAMLRLVRSYAGRSEAEWPLLFQRVLQNRILDWHRRRRTQGMWAQLRVRFGASEDDDAEDSDGLADLPGPGHLEPLHALRNGRLGQALDEALRRLPLRQQQAFFLRAWEGLDVAETAQAMGCTEGSVKTHYSRAVHTLRELLEDHV